MAMERHAPFTSVYPIRFSHTDMAGIVYYPNYFDMFQALVEDWFDRSLGIGYAELIRDRKIGLPSVKVGCEFMRPTRIGDQLALTVHLERIGGSSIALRITGAVGGAACLKGEVVLVTMSVDTMRAIPLPEDILARLSAYRDACAGSHFA
jgi:4-hydroxybenzoyl-CoA thioesterase